MAQSRQKPTQKPRYIPEPVSGEDLKFLERTLEPGTEDPETEYGRMRATDTGFLFNIPIPRIPALMAAPSSFSAPDLRVRKAPDNHVPDEDLRTEAKNPKRVPKAATIRPNLAILIRLLTAHPKYTDILPPKPSNRMVYWQISRLVKRFNEKRAWRGAFAQLFGRSKISSYKMLPADFEKMAVDRRENSQPVIRLQMLIMERFGKIFRDTYHAFCYSDMPERVRGESRYQLKHRNWLALKEWEDVTAWMTKDVRARFDETVKEKCTLWFEQGYLHTLDCEARSRNLTLEQALKEGKWANSDRVSPEQWRTYSPGAEPILGGQGIFENFREMVRITSPEMLWLLGLQIKSYFRYREHPDQRIDPSVSILVRHFYEQRFDDLGLFITHPLTGKEILKRIQAIDPSFDRKHMGLLFGGGVVAGYNMTQEDAPVPFFAYRLASIFTRHIDDGPEIYWHLREAAEQEVKARGLDIETFWREGDWYQED